MCCCLVWLIHPVVNWFIGWQIDLPGFHWSLLLPHSTQWHPTGALCWPDLKQNIKQTNKQISYSSVKWWMLPKSQWGDCSLWAETSKLFPLVTTPPSVMLLLIFCLWKLLENICGDMTERDGATSTTSLDQRGQYSNILQSGFILH